MRNLVRAVGHFRGRLLALMLLGVARAEQPSPTRLIVRGQGDCPSEAAVTASLRPLLPDWEISPGVQIDESADHTVLWAPGMLHIDGQPQVPPAASRDCPRAAEDLAVVIALVLAPPSVAAPPTAPEPPPLEPRTLRTPAWRGAAFASLGLQASSGGATSAAPHGAVDVTWEGEHWASPLAAL